MGKKRAVSVRRIGETLIKLNPNEFTSDFEENKKLISNMMQFPSRAARNKVAGFISRFNKSTTVEKVQPDLQTKDLLDETK